MKSYKIFIGGLLFFMFLILSTSYCFAVNLSYIEVDPNDITVLTTSATFDAWCGSPDSTHSVTTEMDSWSYVWISTKPSVVTVASSEIFGDLYLSFFNLVAQTDPYIIKLTARSGTSTVSGYLRFTVPTAAIQLATLEVQPRNIKVKSGSNAGIFGQAYDQFDHPINQNPLRSYKTDIAYEWSISSTTGATLEPYISNSDRRFTATTDATAVGNTYTITCTATMVAGSVITPKSAQALVTIVSADPNFSSVTISPETNAVAANTITRYTSTMKDGDYLLNAANFTGGSFNWRTWEASPSSLANITPLTFSWSGLGAVYNQPYSIHRALAIAGSAGSGTISSIMTDKQPSAASVTQKGSGTFRILGNTGQCSVIVPTPTVMILGLTQVATLSAYVLDDDGASQFANWSWSIDSGAGTQEATFQGNTLNLAFKPGSGRTARNYTMILTATALDGSSTASFTIPVLVGQINVGRVDVVPANAFVKIGQRTLYAALPYDSQSTDANYIDPLVYKSKLSFKWTIDAEAGTLEVQSDPYKCYLYVSSTAREYRVPGTEYIISSAVSFEGQTTPVIGTTEVLATSGTLTFNDVEVSAPLTKMPVSSTVILKAYMKDNQGHRMSGKINYTSSTWFLNQSYLGKIYNLYIQSLNDVGVASAVFNSSTIPQTVLISASIESDGTTRTSSSPAAIIIGGGGGGDVTVTNKLALTYPVVMTPSTPYALPSAVGSIYKAGDLVTGTIIQYELNQNASVTLYVYDISGTVLFKQEYASGANGGAAGQNYINWNARDMLGRPVSNGVYLTKIVSGGRVIGSGKVTAFE